jgi:glycine oxidase
VATAPSSKSYDAVVIGAGVIGLACAWRAAQRGLSVLVVDRGEPGSGASGVAAGMLAPVTEAEFGEEALLALNLESARAWPAFAAELGERSGLATGYRQTGALVAAADRDDAEELRRLYRFERSLGLDAEWLAGRDWRRLEPRLSPRVAGGIVAPQDHQVEPRSVVRALVAALEHEGGELLAGVEVALDSGDGRVRGVRIPDGEVVAAAHVVVAAGAWSGALGGVPDDALPPVRPVKGQILRLRGPAGAPVASRLVRTPRCYVVPRPDGEVVVGATVEERGFDTSVTGDGVYRLLEAAIEVLPDVGELEFVEAAARLRPGSPDNAPLIGRSGPDGLVWATGHHRNGVLLAPVTAAAVAALLADEDAPETVAPFAPGRFAERRLVRAGR